MMRIQKSFIPLVMFKIREIIAVNFSTQYSISFPLSFRPAFCRNLPRFNAALTLMFLRISMQTAFG